MEWSAQESSAVRVEWGPAGAAVLARGCACLVVVDVLSFSTSVSVAVERGTRVHPYGWGDDTAVSFAAELGATLAVGRRAGTTQHPWSLSPAALRHAPAVPSLVLPSLNGSAIASAATGYGRPVVAACLRNATAVGRWLAGAGYGTSGRPVGIIAAGERWPDGSLRPALEDALGAGAVVAALAAATSEVDNLSAEAMAVRAVVEACDVAALVWECASGRELVRAGFGADVEIAVELDASTVVPLLTDGAFGPA